MKTERVLLSVLAVVLGLLVAGIVFFLYENTRNTPQEEAKIISPASPTPPSKSSVFLTVDKPKDEEVVEEKVIDISGKTTADAIVIVLTNNDEQVLTPTGNGDFSTTTTLEENQNFIETTAIAPNGESVHVLRVVTYSTEEF
ncbi:MAG: hypothetical protein ACD_50C00340G0003 [uncultured bacterium]|nr:MAG: hypothetical protein ACD_50C00340G0003 [uncultured bacterium]OGH14116.1 MAG: hypothetical protein A2687_02520 [Candidatus Levybacteria bacterium RIFCSPHIGHO2_01_FULL_38_26]